MMIVPKSDIKTIYTYLLTEGVMVVKKDVRLPKHADIPVANLHAMSVLKSLKSRGFVTEEFSWQHHYYYLNDEGIMYLRGYLHMPESVVPATIAKAAARRPREEEGERRPRGEEGYRRGGWRGKQEATA
ncbi:hypothetical protein PSACC_02525 [Paramicrosporidium saccamoebae]|uniref:Plectin/eS10 N-terminal domain-containing protein n=1 Tax=Paramicrosporidium saccamoebae TaxID=1246581 RepID=A0A2H9TIU1_9FUNG|nr:hypothetical protein PSACC_02525 [Paramicrosporidium saccamoebae]